MAKQVRWKCETCDDGLLAPSRPRKNDVRRYCLPCSAKGGILVERIAPALEKQREQRAAFVSQKVQEKRVRQRQKLQPIKEQAKRAKQRQAIFEKEADRIWSLFYPEGTFRKRPRINIVFTRKRGCSGVNRGGNILLRIDRTSSGGVSEWELLAHELCHSVVPTSLKNGSHGKAFYVALKNVIEKRWKVRMDWSSINGFTDSSHSWGYKVDWLMRAQLDKSGIVNFNYPADQIEKQIKKKKEIGEVQPKIIEAITANDLVTIYIPKFFIEELEYHEFFSRTESAIADDKEWELSCEVYSILIDEESKRDIYRHLHEAFEKSKKVSGGCKVSIKASALATLKYELEDRVDVADDKRIDKMNEKLMGTIERYIKAIRATPLVND